jgi:hypothetical protein
MELLVQHGPIAAQLGNCHIDPHFSRGMPIPSDLSDFPLANSCGNGKYVSGGQTLRVSVEGIPPSTIPNIVCPPVKGVTDPAASVTDASQPPLTIPDSATSVDRNLEVLRGLSEPDLLRLLEKLQATSSCGRYRKCFHFRFTSCGRYWS